MILDEYRKETDYCTYCPKMCRFSCPVAETELRETVTPTGKQTIVHLVREGALELNEETTGIFFKCTGCLHCQVYCAHEIDVPRALESARTYAYSEGKTLPVAFNLAETVRKSGNALGRPLLPELKKLVPAEYIGREGGVLFFPGAHLIAEREGRDLRRAVAVLQALGVEDLALPDQELMSAGIELLDMGDREGFAAHAAKVRAMIEPYHTVLTPAPEHAWAIDGRYQEVGQSAAGRVKDFAGYVLEKLDALSPELKPVGRKMVYHDPCVMARRLDSIDAPREILRRCGVELEEAPWHGTDTNCCGAGGGYADVFPEEATQMAQARLAECGLSRGGTLVSCSPRCESHLRAAAGDSGAQVSSLIEVLAESLGLSQ